MSRRWQVKHCLKLDAYFKDNPLAFQLTLQRSSKSGDKVDITSQRTFEVRGRQANRLDEIRSLNIPIQPQQCNVILHRLFIILRMRHLLLNGNIDRWIGTNLLTVQRDAVDIGGGVILTQPDADPKK